MVFAINVRKLPEGERQHALFIDRLLNRLPWRCEEFEAAVELFEFSHSPHVPSTKVGPHGVGFFWTFIAAREAASALYRFSEDMKSIGANLNSCRTLAASIDARTKREATRRFSQHFPGYAAIRHVGQHQLYGTPKDFAEHSGGNVLSTGNISRNVYQVMFEKREFKLEISAASLAKMREVCDLYRKAFEPALI
jgi:hypothetical protein